MRYTDFMNWFIDLLAMFGITAATKPFAVLAVLIIGGVVYIKNSLGKPLGKIKDNMLVVVTHLCTGKGKLDTNLIKQMSPLQIQPAGKRILHESGFIEVFNANEEKFFSIISGFKPASKLEVETVSIFSYLEVMNKDGIMTKVKSYLYDHPSVRDTFPTLAGVFIRDKYLEKNKNIK